jgi:hypothetical protein
LLLRRKDASERRNPKKTLEQIGPCPGDPLLLFQAGVNALNQNRVCVPWHCFHTSSGENTLHTVPLSSDCRHRLLKIDGCRRTLFHRDRCLRRFRAKGFTKHHSDRTLLVYDDLVGSNLFSAKKENPFKRLNTTQRHYSISTMMVSQGYKEIPKTVRTNASCLVLFEINNEAEVEVIYEENSAGYSKLDWYRMYRECTSEPFGFMVLNYQKPKGQRVWKGFERCIG